MSELLTTFSQAISALTLTADIALVIFLVLWLFDYLGIKIALFTSTKDFLQSKALLLSFLIALGGVVGSLFYSNVLGFEPCALCWWARVLLYPQALILALAWPKNDKTILSYLVPLSVLGVLIMIYNQALQMGWIGSSSIFCGTGESADCSIRFVFDYSFVTIPMMALTAFGWLVVLGILGKKRF
jgi:disulfide bond formation protein DsbB